MELSRGGRTALTGVAFVILLVAAFIVSGETPTPDDSVQEVVTFYTDNDSEQLISSILMGLSVVFFLFFLGVVRSVLRSTEGTVGGLSAVAFAGGVVAAVGMLIFAGLTFTLGDAAEDLEPAAVQTLSALNSDLFFPLAAGMATFLIASGLVAIRTRVLPVWLGWAALVLGVAGLTPAGFFAFLASVAWVLVVSIVLARGRSVPVA